MGKITIEVYKNTFGKMTHPTVSLPKIALFPRISEHSVLGFLSNRRTDALWRSKCVSLQIFEIELNRWLGKPSLIIIIGEFASNKRATPLVW